MDNKTITIREYATRSGVSYEAVRKQVQRYSKELEGHKTLQGKTVYLDEYARDFLDKHRQPRNVVVKASNEETEEQIAMLRNEVDKLRQELLKAKNTQLELIEYKAKAEVYLEQKAKNEEKLEQALESLKESDLRAKGLEVELEGTKEALEGKKKELESFQPSLFGFYRKKPL